MKRRAPSANRDHAISEYFKYYRPEGGMRVRLFAEDDSAYPPTGEPAASIFPICIPPRVPAGRYRLQYYDAAGNEIASIDDREPWIDINGQGQAQRSPAELNEEEDIRNQRIERREQWNRRLAAQTSMLEQAALINERLARTVAENNERHSRTLAEFQERHLAQTIEREAAVMRVVKEALGIVQEHARSAGQSNEQQARMMEHLVDKARENSDWAGVAKEVVAQLGGLAKSVVTAPRQGVILDGEIQPVRGKPAAALAPETAPRLSAHREESKIKKESPPDPSVAAARAAGSAGIEPIKTQSESRAADTAAPNPPARPDDSDEISWFEQFFGISDQVAVNDTKSATPAAPEAPIVERTAQQQDETSAQATAYLAAAPDAPKPEDIAAFVEALQAMMTPPSMADAATVDPDSDGAPTRTEGDAQGGALVPVGLMELLTKLSTPNLPAAPPRPKEWSRGWALSEIKRRILSLGEMGFLLTATQPRRLLRFLQELIAAVSPPTLAGAEA